MPVTIDYYLTLNSPWAFLGGERFHAMAAKAGATVRVKPAKFAEVFAETGGLPVAKRAPQRIAYRTMELKRWRDYHGIPINLAPKVFPGNETEGARLVIAADRLGLAAVRLATEIGRAVWVREEDIADDAVLAAAAGRAGMTLAQIRAGGMSHDELDGIWTENTRGGINRGVFGAPSYVFPSGEIFWGQDRLDFVERALAAGG